MAILSVLFNLRAWSIVCILAVLFYLYLYLKSYLRRRKLIGVHGCKAPPVYKHRFPVLGLDEILDSINAAKLYSYLSRQRAQFQRYGTTFSSRFYTSTVINTIEPENIKTVLSTKFEDYGVGTRRKDAFAPLLGCEHSIFQLDGKEWRRSRSLLKPCFKRSQISDLHLFESHVQDLLKALPTKTLTTVDLGPLFLRYAANITRDLMFGRPTCSLETLSDANDTFLNAMHAAQRGCEKRWQLGKLANLLPMRAYRANVTIVHAYMRSKISDALKALPALAFRPTSGQVLPQSFSFLRLLLQISVSPRFLHDQLLTLFMAGADTTAAHLTSLFHGLSRHPLTWQTLRTEIASLNLGTHAQTGAPAPPTLVQLRSLKYVYDCINECHRLYPVLPSNSRIALHDTVLPTGGGTDGRSTVFVAKGTMVAFSATALHRRKDLWGDDADMFRPERWAELRDRDDEAKLGTIEGTARTPGTAEKGVGSWAYIPFSAGPRVCVGQELATIEIAYLLVRLVQCFERVDQRDGEDWVEGLAMACTSKNGAKVAMVPG